MRGLLLSLIRGGDKEGEVGSKKGGGTYSRLSGKVFLGEVGGRVGKKLMRRDMK